MLSLQGYKTFLLLEVSIMSAVSSANRPFCYRFTPSLSVHWGIIHNSELVLCLTLIVHFVNFCLCREWVRVLLWQRQCAIMLLSFVYKQIFTWPSVLKIFIHLYKSYVTIIMKACMAHILYALVISSVAVAVRLIKIFIRDEIRQDHTEVKSVKHNACFGSIL